MCMDDRTIKDNRVFQNTSTVNLCADCNPPLGARGLNNTTPVWVTRSNAILKSNKINAQVGRKGSGPISQLPGQHRPGHARLHRGRLQVIRSNHYIPQ